MIIYIEEYKLAKEMASHDKWTLPRALKYLSDPFIRKLRTEATAEDKHHYPPLIYKG